MIHLRPVIAGDPSQHGCHYQNFGVWVIVYSVAFKRPRSGRLRWVYCFDANTHMEASRAARDKMLPGEREYGISRGVYIYVTPTGRGDCTPWLLNPSRVPDDVEQMSS